MIRAGLVAALVGCSSPAPKVDAALPFPGDDMLFAVLWSTGAPVANGAIQETAAVAVAGKIYLIGGFDDTEGITSRVQVYDTATGTWSDGPALPRGLHHVNAATDGTTIYIGGALLNVGFAAVGDTYSLAPETQTAWQTLTPMPTGRERGSAVADIIDGKLYVAGGFRNGGSSALVDVYDPDTNMWTPLADLPATRDHACGGAVGGDLVVAGGRTQGSPQTDTWAFDPGSNAWTPRAGMPTARAGMGCGIIDGVLYATGGEGNPAVPSGVFANVEAYDLASNKWAVYAPMPNPKHGVGGATWGGALYLCGGADQEGFGAIATTDVFRP